MAKGIKKLKEMKIVDGKASPDSEAFKNMKTIDEALGIAPSNAFKATSEEQFNKMMDDMNLADLQALAPRVGLLAVHDRPLLRKRLMDEFKKDLRKRTPYEFTHAVGPTDGLDYSMDARARRILKEGQ